MDGHLARIATLARIARNSFNASFLESRRREELKAELDAYLESWPETPVDLARGYTPGNQG